MEEAETRRDPKVFLILGWIFAVVTLFFLPILFGPAAIVMGALAIPRGAKVQGILIIVLAIVFMILSMLLGVLAFSYFSSHTP
ncbi:hypothetical protein [Tumebacillus flagellatus]|uniref:DUF4190 domain-containing protein n=1 Tax=Tumebacillus flagellatus TaxID=1157490 RepID=A0A074M5T5_9BACL|nr:hypothetical protein [Tumebacillus flagellatus]KEO81372.1 hypothetical protein EL26_21280 [Tumebacillus flagellatus]